MASVEGKTNSESLKASLPSGRQHVDTANLVLERDGAVAEQNRSTSHRPGVAPIKPQ